MQGDILEVSDDTPMYNPHRLPLMSSGTKSKPFFQLKIMQVLDFRFYYRKKKSENHRINIRKST